MYGNLLWIIHSNNNNDNINNNNNFITFFSTVILSLMKCSQTALKYSLKLIILSFTGSLTAK